MRKILMSLSLAAVAAAIVPASSLAATTTSVVTGTIGTELSLSAATPAAMTLTHSTPGTSSSLVTVTSTQASWTLKISDNNTGTNAGHLLKSGSPLTNALEWSNASNGTFVDLTATPVTLGTGALLGTKTAYLRQSLDASEAVTAGDSYALTALFTVT
jgi:hypothetical protein